MFGDFLDEEGVEAEPFVAGFEGGVEGRKNCRHPFVVNQGELSSLRGIIEEYRKGPSEGVELSLEG